MNLTINFSILVILLKYKIFIIVRQLIKKILKEETKVSNSIKRRANRQTLEKYITDGEINYPTLCDDFGDEFEYADNVISYAVGQFMTIDEDIFEDGIESDEQQEKE